MLLLIKALHLRKTDVNVISHTCVCLLLHGKIAAVKKRKTWSQWSDLTWYAGGGGGVLAGWTAGLSVRRSDWKSAPPLLRSWLSDAKHWFNPFRLQESLPRYLWVSVRSETDEDMNAPDQVAPELKGQPSSVFREKRERCCLFTDRHTCNVFADEISTVLQTACLHYPYGVTPMNNLVLIIAFIF